MIAQKHDCPPCTCTDPIPDFSIKWLKLEDCQPNDDQWCVVWHEDDYHIAYWSSGCGAFDSPDIGWISGADKWYPIPE